MEPPHPQHQLHQPQHQPLHQVQHRAPQHYGIPPQQPQPYTYQQPQPPQPQQPPARRADAPFEGTKNGFKYRLAVEQQPIRARMCGFGDKDRRPITPPPCVRLVVYNEQTGEEIDIEKVDSTFCILQVDLWNEECTNAVNLVRHSSASPTVSISNSTVASYPPPAERAMYIPPAPSQWQGQQPGSYVQHGWQASATYPTAHGVGFPASYPNMMALQHPSPNQHYTRNLIGMNAVNACRLNDLAGKPGFWFVLQDLSVRTEGTFRLKFTMSDIGMGQGTNGVISQGKCPVLATAFSDPFTVYSAKKFPGVVESTPLSKCLAQQGIKIPIRKDGAKDRSNQAEYDADE